MILSGSPIRPVMKQASGRLYVGYIIMLPEMPCTFYFGIYNGYKKPVISHVISLDPHECCVMVCFGITVSAFPADFNMLDGICLPFFKRGVFYNSEFFL